MLIGVTLKRVETCVSVFLDFLTKFMYKYTAPADVVLGEKLIC